MPASPLTVGLHDGQHPWQTTSVPPIDFSVPTAAERNESCASMRTATILTLPPELQLYLSRFLELDTLILYAGMICRPLRHLFGSFARTRLYLVPTHRLSLAEWRRAASELHRLRAFHDGPASRSVSTEAVYPKDIECHNSHHSGSYRNEAQGDLHFLLSVLRFLDCRAGEAHEAGSSADSTTATAAKEESVGCVTCLCLVSWHGLAAADLINLLRNHPMLAHVRMIVKTERLETHAWHEATRANAYRFAASRSSYETGTPGRPTQRPLSERPKVDRGPRRSSASSSDASRCEKQFVYERCTVTQAILQVGKRRGTKPGEKLLRGEGLQIGFEGLCLEQGGSPADAWGGNDQRPPSSPSRVGPRLHVVLQQRYENPEEDTVEVEELFVRSVVTCNQCKQVLAF